MAVRVPNGSLWHIASGYGSVLTVSALTNADPAVATSTAHGLSDGDIVEVTSGWSRLTNKIVRIDGSDTNSFQLEGIDTSNTSIYSVGGGTGSVREITGWTQLQQILGVSTAGGEQQFLDYQYLEDDAQKRIPTFKSPITLTLNVGDDPTLAGYLLAEAANDDRLVRALRCTLPSGALIFYNGFVSVNKTPSMNVNELMQVPITVALQAEPVRYSGPQT